MASRIFQSIVLQLKESSHRTVGVIDGDGIVVACSELSLMGTSWENAVEVITNSAGERVTFDGKTFKALVGASTHFDYATFITGEDEEAKILCAMATVSLNGAKTYYEERHDKATFVKSIISDNIMLGDVYTQAKELHFDSEVPRVAFLIRQTEVPETGLFDCLQGIFPDKSKDFVISVSEEDVAVIKQLSAMTEGKELVKMAQVIADDIEKELHISVVVGIGTVVAHVRDLARSYKEAGIAIDVGKVFDTEKMIINYENLGIGRIIYQLPTVLCQMFLQEVFKKDPIDALDQETLLTIHKFFENNLNVSETARKLFVHRNTLVYRLEKIKKLTGLDLREFDDAITFQVALMVNRYLLSRGIEV
ncbi:MAG: helix-turn-helix domain-containing protein [Eubacteriales bacterium]